MIKRSIEELLLEYEVLILSGGVSKGKRDFIPEVLKEIGFTKLFHKVKQRPGKPFWFGVNKEGKIVFALPGNPVSSFMCMYKYVMPWIDKVCNISRAQPFIKLGEDIEFKPDLTYFVPVRLRYSENGDCEAFMIKGNGSGDMTQLIGADGCLELTSGIQLYQKGQAYKFIAFN